MAEFKDKHTTVKLTVGELFTEYAEYHSHETRRTSHEKAMVTIQSQSKKKNARERAWGKKGKIKKEVTRGEKKRV